MVALTLSISFFFFGEFRDGIMRECLRSGSRSIYGCMSRNL